MKSEVAQTHPIWRYKKNVGFEVLTTVIMNSAVFWVSTPCSLERTCRLSFLLRLLFHPENGGDVFLRNVGLSPSYTALQLIIPYAL
jgi:hypothetical protein